MFDAVLSACSTTLIEKKALPFMLLFTGFTGGVGHCAAMCGPLILGQIGERLLRSPSSSVLSEVGRFHKSLLIPYHLGRITTYTCFGAVAAALGHGASMLTGFVLLRTVLLLGTAFYFAFTALRRLSPRLSIRLSNKKPTCFREDGSRKKTRLLLLFSMSKLQRWGGFPLGLAMGFLPCGLIYAALAAVAAEGSIAWGAISMALFGLGTAPSLMAVGIAGNVVGRRLTATLATLAPIILLLNAVMLSIMAVAQFMKL